MNNNSTLNVDMLAFQNGDTKCFEQIFNFYFPFLSYFAKNIVRDNVVAEDIAIMTLEKIWDKRLEILTSTSLKAWLFISTKNKCLNHLRHLEVKNRTFNDIKYLSENTFEEDILRILIKSEVLLRLFNCLVELSPQQRLIMRMKHVEEKSNEEIANFLKISISTVKTQAARGLAYLRKNLSV